MPAGASLMVAEFLSTPSARRATRWVLRRFTNQTISIHALREEGDPQPGPPSTG